MTVYSLQQSGLEYLEDLVAPTHQGWKRQVTVRWQGHKILATAHRDFYRPQCHFNVKVWSPATLSWNIVQTLPPESVIADPNDPAWKRNLDHFADPSVDPYILTQDVVDSMIAYAQQVLS